MSLNCSLGLDISTSIIGASFIFENNTFLFKHIDLTKTKCFFDKTSLVEEFLNNIISEVKLKNIKKVYIEDSLQSFRKGMSSAKTLMTLAKFNGIVSNIVFRITKIKPDFINVNTARKTLNIKIDKNSSIDKKEQIMEWVNNDVNGYDWPTKIISRGVNKGVVKFEKFCYDISDAYVICKAGIIINEQYT